MNLRLVFLLPVLLLCYITTILNMSRTANATVACLDVIKERFFVCVIRGTMLVSPRPSYYSYSSDPVYFLLFGFCVQPFTWLVNPWLENESSQKGQRNLPVSSFVSL